MAFPKRGGPSGHTSVRTAPSAPPSGHTGTPPQLQGGPGVGGAGSAPPSLPPVMAQAIQAAQSQGQ